MNKTIQIFAIAGLLSVLISSVAYAYINEQYSGIATHTILNVPYFYVDNNTSDVDSVGDVGDHSNFGAQQQAPDSIYDTLLEGIEENWLDGWDKRVKIEIDQNDIDNVLSEFPILIHLSSSSGRNNDDVSFVFDEIQSDANRKKIAVTTSDGTSQCYVEVENWSDVDEQAWLWVKVPNISNTSDTSLYFYYDSDHADNTDYVDDTNTGVSTYVWSDGFRSVLHLNQSPSGQNDEMKDSSTYENHGTSEGSMNSSDLVGSKIGYGLEFDEVDDLIRIPNSTSLSFSKDSGTFELWINWNNATDGDSQIVMTSSNRFSGVPQDGFEWASQSNGNHFFYPWGGDNNNYNLGSNPFTNGVWHHLAVTYLYSTKEVEIFVDGISMNFSTENVPTIWTQLANSTDYLWGGNPDRSTRNFNGLFDEIRIHNTARSNPWIKTSYENGKDDLLVFANEETLAYELDLELQWSDVVDFSETNEELCIYLSDYTQGSFDASGGYMIVGDGSSDWGSVAGTISFWVKMDSTVQGRFWGQHGDMETRWSGSNLVLDWGGVGSMTSATSFSADTWYFVAIVWDEISNNLFLYVGDEVNPPTADVNSLNGTWTGTTPVSTENRFLNGLGGDQPVDGHGDELRYYNIDRNLSQIQSDYNVTISGSETNLRSYFRLNNNFDDIGPNDNDGFGSGSYSFSTDTPINQTATESLKVDVWTGSDWQNIFAQLTNGWNNASISSYLVSSTLTIRLKGNIETGDSNQDNWNIDSSVIHAWT